jgi:hypothetical protein
MTNKAQVYGHYEVDFCCHYQEHHDAYGGSYDQYRPAYRYGYDLGVHTHYGAGAWVQIEPEAHTLWEARNPGTWEQFKEPIQYAWATASGKR